MSVVYTVYLIPEADSVDFVPSGRQIVDARDTLADLGWTQRADAYTVRADFAGTRAKSVASTTMVEELDELLANGRAFVVELPEPPELRSDKHHEFTENADGVLQPEHCIGASLCCAPELFSVPIDNITGDTLTPCPTCGADVLQQISSDDPALGVLDREYFFMAVPPHCPSCNAALNPGELLAQIPSGITGEPMSEPAPFGRLVIAVEAPQPPKYPHEIDPSLLERLRETLGVRYRHVGRWS